MLKPTSLAPFENDAVVLRSTCSPSWTCDSATGTASNPYTAVQQQQGAIQSFQIVRRIRLSHMPALKSVQAALGSKGLLDSGAAMKSLDNYGINSFLVNSIPMRPIGALSAPLSSASAQAGVGQGYANATTRITMPLRRLSGNASQVRQNRRQFGARLGADRLRLF